MARAGGCLWLRKKKLGKQCADLHRLALSSQLHTRRYSCTHCVTTQVCTSTNSLIGIVPTCHCGFSSARLSSKSLECRQVQTTSEYAASPGTKGSNFLPNRPVYVAHMYKPEIGANWRGQIHVCTQRHWSFPAPGSSIKDHPAFIGCIRVVTRSVMAFPLDGSRASSDLCYAPSWAIVNESRARGRSMHSEQRISNFLPP